MTRVEIPPVLEQAWHTHVAADDRLLTGLATRHRERQRRYHRIEHVAAVVGDVVELAAVEPVSDLGAVVAAAFYHDAIYEPTHPANERASARLARRDLLSLGWDDVRVAAVGAMIEGTRSHLAPPDVDTAVLFDADLAVLGADPEAYRTYVAQVRDEYRHLDDGEWRAGRATVLGAFLQRDRLFATRSGQHLWDAAARRNIADELRELGR